MCLKATANTPKKRLRTPVLGVSQMTTRTRLARAMRWHQEYRTTTPGELIAELTVKLTPALIEDGLIEA
jgi:hypothetical protein